MPESSQQRSPLSSGERSKVLKAALSRPMNLLMLGIGAVVFATTLHWWVLLPTLATYGALVALSARDPLFQRRILQGRPAATTALPSRDISPERRARWLPRGETRERIEEALVTYRKVTAAIEEADDVTRAVLEGAIPRLHTAADRLVEVAHRRETAAKEVRPQKRSGSNTAEIEAEIRAADEEISATMDALSELRARIVRISILDSGSARTEATSLASSLDEMNYRLEALNATFSPSEDQPR